MDRSQQQTLSVRISETLRRRLERLRQHMASRTGQSVSTSEIAKQLLESAREDRLELVDLLAEPTAALLQIRRKGDAGLTLSRAEWTVIAHFVQQGLEAFTETTPNRVSRASVLGVLDAFLALYDLRREGGPPRDPYYLGNLPPDTRPSSAKRAERDETITADLVRRTAAETRRRLSDPTAPFVPLFIGRNLYVLLEDDKLPGAEVIHRALVPYWPVLWRLAARGHFVLTETPIRESGLNDRALQQLPIPPVSDGIFTLSVMRAEGHDLSVLISFPGPLGPTYPVSLYPKLTEFRAMLAALQPDRQRQWAGQQFVGYVTSADLGASQVWFRAPENGISIGVTVEQWTALQALFRRAWDLPDVRIAWDALANEYGEL